MLTIGATDGCIWLKALASFLLFSYYTELYEAREDYKNV